MSDFNFHRPRAEKARINASLGQLWRVVFIMASIALVVAGVAFIFLGHSAGWLCLGFASIPMMIVEWQRGELRDIPLGSTNGVEDQITDWIYG